MSEGAATATVGVGEGSPHHDEAGHRRDAYRAIGISAIGLASQAASSLRSPCSRARLLYWETPSTVSLTSRPPRWSSWAFRFRNGSQPRAIPTYERAEDLAGLGVALVIWGSAVFAGIESYLKLVGNGGTTHVGIGMAGAALGIVGNQVVARYKLIVGRRIQSATLLADARHSWLDALSSFGALVGLCLVALGQRWGDPIAGFAVTLFILHVGYRVTSEILFRLMDGVDVEATDAARRVASGVLGAPAVVRGRWMGRSLLLDVELPLREDVRLGDAAIIARQVEVAIFAAVPAARQVTCRSRPVSASDLHEEVLDSWATDAPQVTA